MQLYFSHNNFYFSGKVSELKIFMKDAVQRHRLLSEMINSNLN